MPRASVGESKDISTARERVHRAFKTATSRGAVAPFCCMLDGKHPCGVLCDELTAATSPTAVADAVFSALAGLDKYVSLNCWREDGVGEYVVTAKSVHEFVVETRKLLAGLTDRGGR